MRVAWTIKGKPASGRAILSQEMDGNKSHSHAAQDTDLGQNYLILDYARNRPIPRATSILTSPAVISIHTGRPITLLPASRWCVICVAGDHAYSLYRRTREHTMYIGPHDTSKLLWTQTVMRKPFGLGGRAGCGCCYYGIFRVAITGTGIAVNIIREYREYLLRRHRLPLLFAKTGIENIRGWFPAPDMPATY